MNAFSGGRRAALAALARIRPGRYGGTRNFLSGAVSRLSPYLRHGVLELAEVRDAALAHGGRIDKFVQELGWRDYYRRVYAVLGDGVRADIEPYKTGFRADDYAAELPADVAEARTGLACMDAFVSDLRAHGWLHNHARMWFASYVVHHRRVRWQAGAALFLRELLDGDPASNDLSWQWVASTFGGKPYIFDRANLARYTDDAYCKRCPLANGGCPFDAPYRELDARLFPHARSARVDAGGARVDAGDAPPLRISADADAPAPVPPSGKVVLWQHADALSEVNAARRAFPAAPAVYALDDVVRARDGWSAGVDRFIAECLAEMHVEQRAGETVATVLAFAREHRAEAIVTVATPDPAYRAVLAALRAEIPVVALAPPPFAVLDRTTDLRRFSRYWKRAQVSATAPTATAPPVAELELR